MSDFFQVIISHKYLSFISILIAVFSILLAWFFYLKSKKKIWLTFTKFQTNIIDKDKNDYNKLSITYDGEALEAFYTSDIIFRNNGNVSIRKADIPISNSIRISGDSESNILEVRTTYQKNPNNYVQLSQIGQSTMNIEFDFLNPKDEFILRVLHTGEISVLGVVIGQTLPMQKELAISQSYNRLAAKYLTFLFKRKRRKWLSFLVNFVVSTLLFSNLYFNELNPFWKLINIIFGINFAYAAIRALFRKPSELSDEERILRLESIIGSSTQKFQNEFLAGLKRPKN